MNDTLKRFESCLTGDFDNSAQIAAQQAAGKVTHPAARHVSRNVNSRVGHLPADPGGFFVLEESYYTRDGRTNAMPHLFFFSSDAPGRVELDSYDLPKDLPRAELVNGNPALRFDYRGLSRSETFTPLVYQEDERGVFYGRCVSRLSADTTLTLEEWIGPEVLLVTEILEKAGRVLVGVPSPIEYRRITK